MPLQETFVRAQLWLKELEKYCIPGSIVIWLVGNKVDLAEDRKVSVQVQEHKVPFFIPIQSLLHVLTDSLLKLYVITQEGQSLANDRGLFFMETSALSGDQISQLLLAVGK